jgi:hypothetical protein
MADLPPTQYLVMEVLAARHRLGETLWTFPSNLRQTMEQLARQQLIGWKSGVAPASIQAWLTDTGRAEVLKPDYVPPILRADGYQRAIAVLNGVAARSGSPAARWAAEYLAADPDRALLADSCTCPPPYRTSAAADPDCPVHHGRRARGPKPPPLGPDCICDGSGRTCPRHGAVL